MEVSFVAAVLIAAVILHDRLGGSDEVARRFFQVGLAVSLAFVAIAATLAFVHQDGGIAGIASSASNDSDTADRLTTSVMIEYGVGVAYVLLGLNLLRKYSVLPLAFVLGGVFLIFIGGADTISTSQLVQIQFSASRDVDQVMFGVAVVGTISLLWYGTQLEREYVIEPGTEDDLTTGDETESEDPPDS